MGAEKMIIRPETLRYHRERVPMSQDALATASRVSKKTIARIETGRTNPNPTTVRRLAEALRLKPEALSKAPDQTADPERELRKLGYRPIKAHVDGETAIAFEMVEELYGIPIQSQILMAPLFAALLAEGSLTWRRQKVAAVQEAAANLMRLGYGHLSFANSGYIAEQGAYDEEASIEERDLFGNMIGRDAIDHGYDPSANNPFADYLREFSAGFQSETIELDTFGIGVWKTPEGMPEYRIGRRRFDDLTDGDYWAGYALTRGHAKLQDIPKTLRSEEAREKRKAWLADQIPATERQEHEAFLDSIKLDF
jgi:transcriptional regulator with XRE-family HTH domain